jgi:hypothetical protein
MRRNSYLTEAPGDGRFVRFRPLVLIHLRSKDRSLSQPFLYPFESISTKWLQLFTRYECCALALQTLLCLTQKAFAQEVLFALFEAYGSVSTIVGPIES